MSVPTMPAPQRREEANSLAIVTLVLGLLALVPVAVVTGILALRQIKRRGDGGRGLVIGGFVVCGLWIAVAAIALAVFLAGFADRDESGRIASDGYILTYDLRVGDCTNEDAAAEEAPILVDVVPCGEPHDGEVYAVFDLKGDGGFPGIGNVERRSEAGCDHRLAREFPRHYDDLSTTLFYYHPQPLGWRFGDREVACVLLFSPPRTGPLGRRGPRLGDPQRS